VSDHRSALPEKRMRGSWIQTERAAHEEWAQFLALKGANAASRVMHLLLARIGDHNAVVVSQKTLASLLGCDERTVRRAVAMLRSYNWIDTCQIGDRGTVNAYVINDRVGWYGSREGARYSLFSATVVASEAEQPDRNKLGQQNPLHRLPRMFKDEVQLPTGDGLPPPSEPSLPGMEAALPALREADDREPMDDAQPVGTVASRLLNRLGE
jgi:hypothetical protein